MSWPAFLDLPPVAAEEADVLLLPLPYEGSVSYGQGTALGPEAIWRASTEVELYDEQLRFDLETLHWHSAPALSPLIMEKPADYLARVRQAAMELNDHKGLVIGVGGDHSLTVPLALAATKSNDLSNVTVVQFDAHTDLRDEYQRSPHSHACVMRRLSERSANIVAIGIRSASRGEAGFSEKSDHIRTFPARLLSTDLLPGEASLEQNLTSTLRDLQGDIYLTIDIDVLEVHLCPATGTPQPGGLGWWQMARYLHALLAKNRQTRLIGCDLVETVPQPNTQVNEFTAAQMLAKVVALWAS